MIRAVHDRRLAAGADQVWELLTTLSSPHDRVWPGGWPPVRVEGPLAVGARGRRGPVHYDVLAVDQAPGSWSGSVNRPVWSGTTRSTSFPTAAPPAPCVGTSWSGGISGFVLLLGAVSSAGRRGGS